MFRYMQNCSHYVYQYSKAVSTVQNNQNLVFNSSYGSLRGREEELKKREENSNPTTPLTEFSAHIPLHHPLDSMQTSPI